MIWRLRRRRHPRTHIKGEQMTRRLALVAAVALVLAVPVVSAHEGHVHTIMGTVTALDAKHVEVKTPSGEILSIAITGKTSVLRAKRKVAITEIQVGRRVVVDIGNGEDPLIAREIQLGVAQVATK
jgi:hypothetical protein